GWCVLRRLLGRASVRTQRLACWALPAVAAAAICRLAFGSHTPSPGQTLLLATFVGLAGGMVAQHYFELRARAFSPAIDEAKFQALQSRIRPHFFFNSLNAVLSVIREDPPRAERMLESVAELFRAVMGDVKQLVPLEHELDLCRRYVEIEQTRLGERLHVEWNIGAVH